MQKRNDLQKSAKETVQESDKIINFLRFLKSIGNIANLLSLPGNFLFIVPIPQYIKSIA